MFIVFSGTDGAGKSTQIKLLEDYFNRKNIKTKSLWSRGGYTPLFSLIKKIARLFSFNKLPKSGPSPERSILFKDSKISYIWLCAAIIDLIIYYSVYLRILKLFKRVIICDRYIQDTLLDFNQNFSGVFNEQMFLWKLLLFVCPSPSLHFLLYVPVEVSMHRSKLKNEPFPDSKEVLEFRLNKYLDESLFSPLFIYKINCQGSIDDVFKTIISKIDY